MAPPSVTPVIQIPTVTAMTRTTYAILAMFIFTNISLQISLDVCNTFGLSFQMSSLSKQMSSLSELDMEKVKKIIVLMRLKRCVGGFSLLCVCSCKKLVKQSAMLWDIVAVMSVGLQVNRFQTSAGSLVADV